MKRSVLLGKCDKDIICYLKTYGFEIEILFDNHKVDKRLINHCDLSLLKINEQIFVVERTQTRAKTILHNLDKTVISIDMQEKADYPSDCILNFVVVGRYILGCQKAITECIKSIIDNNKLVFKSINQGYAKCSTIVLNDHSVITDDESVFRAVKEFGIDCLLITKGDVKLDGFNYGFIGGASFVDEQERKVFFFGDITKHSDYIRIKEFIENKSYYLHYIPGKQLTDIGGAVII